MDLSSLLALVPTQYLPYVMGVMLTAALIAVVLPAPTATSGLYYGFYQVINTIALNFWHAKNLSAPEAKGIVGGPGAIIAPKVATSAVPLAIATPAEKSGTIPGTSIPVQPPGDKP